MKLGSTERETLDLNGWTVGDILEGDDGFGPSRIKITAIGEELFLCRWKNMDTPEWENESGNTTLRLREWRKVGRE